jgi:outer membrane protein
LFAEKIIKQQKGETVMRYLSRSFIAVLAVVFALLLSSAAQAQDSPFNIENVPNVVGIGIAMLPDYPGSNDYIVGGAPFFKINLDSQYEYYLRLLATDLQLNLINHPIFRFGPAFNYRFGRSDVEDKVVKHMEDIDDTFEAGAFVGIELVDKDNPRQRFLSQVEFLSDVGNVYKGYNVSLSASYWFPVHKAVDVTFGGGITYADGNYMETYFGVDQENADRTGLSVYEADSGLLMARVNAGAVLHLSMSWHLAAGVQYRPLLDDAADSPIVDDRGSKSQWIYGLGAAYSW